MADDLHERLAARFGELALALRPEHLTKNGKATDEQVVARYRHIQNEWGWLEAHARRKVSPEEFNK